MKVPKNTRSSIILKWKKCGTTKTLPKAGCLAKLNNRWRRALVREVTKNPMVTDSAPEFLCGDGITFQKDNQLCSTGRVARWKPLLSIRHLTARLENSKLQVSECP